MKIVSVVGARPNFMKIAPVADAIASYNSGAAEDARIRHVLVHTGQHYDERMSKLFFEDLCIPRPDVDLEVGSGSHAEQTAEVMKRFEKVVLGERPDFVLVVGDVNSTIACALTAAKLGVGVIHVEAGLRSFDRSMPEEINRLLTDAISDVLFTTERSAMENLAREGVPGDKVFFVGNVMIDTLLKNVRKSEGSAIREDLGLGEGPYGVLTLHRPSNVDDPGVLTVIFDALMEISREIPIVFPIHPRTMTRLGEFGLDGRITPLEGGRRVDGGGIYATDPLGYLDFLCLMANAGVVLTDSGGIQEETTILHVPCITMRENTERPVTLTEGTNRLVGTDRDKIVGACRDALEGRFPRGEGPELWDGKASERIVRVLVERFM